MVLVILATLVVLIFVGRNHCFRSTPKMSPPNASDLRYWPNTFGCHWVLS
jgi:hypothetical protein